MGGWFHQQTFAWMTAWMTMVDFHPITITALRPRGGKKRGGRSHQLDLLTNWVNPEARGGPGGGKSTYPPPGPESKIEAKDLDFLWESQGKWSTTWFFWRTIVSILWTSGFWNVLYFSQQTVSKKRMMNARRQRLSNGTSIFYRPVHMSRACMIWSFTKSVFCYWLVSPLTGFVPDTSGWANPSC